MNVQVWSWLLGAVGLVGFFLAGRRIWWAWYINIANQTLWIAYSLVTQQWGFLAASLVYTVVFTLNARKWTKDHMNHIPLMEEDNNLVRHAQRELALLGEEEFFHDAMVNAVREFTKSGHSGTSHIYAAQMLSDLLEVKNLSPLTDSIDEWEYHDEEKWGAPGGIWQNRRNPAAFSTDAGKTYYDVNDNPNGRQIYETRQVTLREGQEER